MRFFQQNTEVSKAKRIVISDPRIFFKKENCLRELVLATEEILSVLCLYYHASSRSQNVGMRLHE